MDTYVFKMNSMQGKVLKKITWLLSDGNPLNPAVATEQSGCIHPNFSLFKNFYFEAIS